MRRSSAWAAAMSGTGSLSRCRKEKRFVVGSPAWLPGPPVQPIDAVVPRCGRAVRQHAHERTRSAITARCGRVAPVVDDLLVRMVADFATFAPASTDVTCSGARWNGGASGIRTRALLVANETRYQLRPSPRTVYQDSTSGPTTSTSRAVALVTGRSLDPAVIEVSTGPLRGG